MGMSVLGVSQTSLTAALAGIRTTQHNIANAGTDGYHRQEVRLSANVPEFTGGSYYGTGVSADSVVRMYNRFLDNELRTYQGQQSGREVYASYANQVDSLLGDTANSLDTSLQAFFAAVNEVANDPTSLVAREQMLTQGKNLTGRMNLLGSRLETLNSYVNQEINGAVDQINAYATRIAQLNSAIGYGGGQSQLPNDLLDQRDQLVTELNKLVNVTQIQQSDGSTAVFLGNGQPLVVGKDVQKLVAINDPQDASRRSVAIQTAGGTLIGMNLSQVNAGRLGGLIAFRDEMLQPSLDDLGRIAVTIVDQFNTLHASGYTLLAPPDDTGVAFFGPADAMLREPVVNSGNTGNAAIALGVHAGNSQNLTNSDYELRFDAGSYALVRLSDNATVGSGATLPIQADGLSLTQTSGVPANGDRWLIVRPTTFAAADMTMAIDDPRLIAAGSSDAPGDNGNALAMVQLQSSFTMLGATSTFSAAYNQLVSRNAILAGSADTDLKTYNNLVKLTQESQQSVSGVNLDEEAAKLIQYQQSYQAAARSMQIAASLLEEILSIR